jgi:hypothetical protein
VNYLQYILATAAAAILGLLAYGLTPAYNVAWAIGAAAAAFLLVVAASNFLMRPDDRDPTIRPPNVPRKRTDR